MTRFEERLARGEANDAAEWEEYLAAFHERYPAATPLALLGMQTSEGASSYEVLANAVAPLDEGTAVLDVGCGNGFASEAIGAKFPSASYTGIDISASEIALASRTYPRASFAVARAQAVPFEAATFDAVISHLALMLVNDLGRVFSELARVTRPGARVGIVTDNLATMTGHVRDLHVAAGRFAQTVFTGLAKLQMGDAPFSDPEAVKLLAADAGFDPESFRVTDFVVHSGRNKEQVWRHFAWLYVMASMPAEDQARMREIVSAEFDRISTGGTVRFELPMRLVIFRKPL